jgi:UDP-GlcNAc:undecaprenyl-phosphate GlcNAc-1-phosphate transferase
LLIASSVSILGLRLHLFPPGLDHVASVFWILAVTNAFNFMDNMNGLSAGVACAGSLAMGAILEMRGDFFEALLCFVTAGAIVGFLPFNYPRASAFLGDSGSHLLGFIMAAMPLNAAMFGPSLSKSAVPVLLVAVPLFDLIQVVAWRCWHRRPVWIGDRNHLSHRLVSWGLPAAVAVAVLWVLAMIAALLGVILWRRG